MNKRRSAILKLFAVVILARTTNAAPFGAFLYVIHAETGWLTRLRRGGGRGNFCW